MPASRPRRIRVIIIVIIIGQATQNKLTDGIDGSIHEVIFAQLCRAMPIFAIADIGLNSAQAKVWTDIDNLATMFDNGTPTDAQLTTFSGTFGTDLSSAGL